jgi:hypothetical protein
VGDSRRAIFVAKSLRRFLVALQNAAYNPPPFPAKPIRGRGWFVVMPHVADTSVNAVAFLLSVDWMGAVVEAMSLEMLKAKS